MTPQLLTAAGELLHGVRWRAPLADQLGVSTRTVERWAAGTAPIPEGIGGELGTLVQRQIDRLTMLAALLARRAAA